VFLDNSRPYSNVEQWHCFISISSVALLSVENLPFAGYVKKIWKTEEKIKKNVDTLQVKQQNEAL